MFSPQSIVLVGISRKPVTLGRKILNNIINSGYDKTNIYLVNPGADEIEGIKCHKSLQDIEVPLDLLICLIPRKFVLPMAEEAGKLGIKSMAIITAGFREIDQEGLELELEIGKVAKQYNMRIIGPNSMGVYNGNQNLNATFTPTIPSSGSLGFLSQSGALGAVMMGYANDYGMGFSKFFSLGNKLDINENHAIQFMFQDDQTQAIMLYLESFSDPENFYNIARQVSEKKPIIMVKSGRTERGAQAAVSHTGALAGEEVIVDAALQSAGVIRADSMMEMFETARAFEKLVLPRGKRVAIISNAGGPGTLTTDALINHGFEVEDFSKETEDKLSEFLPMEASTSNPIDILPSSGPEGYGNSIKIMLEDDNIDILVPVFLPPVVVSIQDLINHMNPVVKNAKKPIIGIYMGMSEELREFKDMDFPIYGGPDILAKVLRNLANYSSWLAMKKQVKLIDIGDRKEEVRKMVKNAVNNGHLMLNPGEVQQMLRAYEFNLPKESIVDSFEEAHSFAQECSYPVVAKMASQTLTHKTDSGGVFLDISGDDELREAITKIHQIYAEKQVPDDDRKILVQEFLKDNIELAMGIKFDSQFGHTIMLGIGGVFIEVLKDAQFRKIPISRDEAEHMLDRLRSQSLLDGFRGIAPVDREKIIQSLLKLNQLALDNPEIVELDFNPIFAHARGTTVVDARISIDNHKG